MKIRPKGADVLNANGRTDIMKLIVAFRSFASTSKNEIDTFFPVLLRVLFHQQVDRNNHITRKDRRRDKQSDVLLYTTTTPIDMTQKRIS
jgi:hypothetical protein